MGVNLSHLTYNSGFDAFNLTVIQSVRRQNVLENAYIILHLGMGIKHAHASQY